LNEHKSDFLLGVINSSIANYNLQLDVYVLLENIFSVLISNVIQNVNAWIQVKD
jgi:hypothetical protein